MNVYLKYTVCGLLAMYPLYGCMQDNLESDTGMEISLSGGVDGLVVSKAPAEGIYPEDDDILGISLYRWDEGDASWPVADALSGQLGGFVSTSSGARRQITFDSSQYYKDRTSRVGFVGIYPQLSSGQDGAGNWVQSSDGSYLNDDNQLAYKVDGRTDVMVSDFKAGSQTSGIEPLPFRHALCMFNFYIYAVDDASKAEWGNLKEVKIVNLPETVRITLPDASSGKAPVFEPGVYPSNPTDDSSVLSLSDFSVDQNGLGTDSGYELQVGLPSDLKGRYVGTVLGGKPNGGILGLMVEAVGASDLNSVSIARDFQPGYTYNVVLRFSTSGIVNADVTVEDWHYGGDYYTNSGSSYYNDLSRYGTANCYVVSSANMKYCFDATVKGNGVSEIENERLGVMIPLLGENPVIDISKVDTVEILRSDAVMKQDGGTMKVITDMDERKSAEIISLDSGVLRDGKVLFTVHGNDKDKTDYSLQYEGNVKIGVKDKDGNILWSWHIWVTDTPINQNYLNGHVAMDRNLGAVISSVDEWYGQSWPDGKVYAEYAWGLYYQFGRKDPMFIPSLYTEEGGYVSSSMAADITEAHKKPMVFFYQEGSDEWLAGADTDHLWGYVSQRDNYVKTMYDPCPPGYRVAGKEIWQTQNDEYRVDAGVDASKGTLLHIGSYEQVFFPVSHSIYKGVAALSDREGSDNAPYTYLLSATPDDGTGNAYHFRYNREDAASDPDFPLIVPDANAGDNYLTGKSVAYPVRCVFESSGAIVTDLSEAQTANSYIIQKTGFYKFKANVRGNGVTDLTVYTSSGVATMPFDDGMTANLAPARVDLLWWQGDLTEGSPYLKYIDKLGNGSGLDSDAVSSECPVHILDGGSVDREGYVTLYARVSDAVGSGNVGLVAYDDYNNILWTWHFWLIPEYGNVQVGDYSLMDRNLGATWAPDRSSDINSSNVRSTYGFYYQWGRKDPFFPPTSDSKTTSPWLYKDPRSGWQIRHRFGASDAAESLSGPVLISESVKSPLSFVAVDQNDWQDSYTSNEGIRNNLWGYTGNAVAQGNAFAKTMYDPCPPGYKVMPHNVVQSAGLCSSEEYDDDNYIDFSGTQGQATTAGVMLSAEDRPEYSKSKNINNIIVGDQGLWLPFSGRLNSIGEYAQMPYDAGYWSTATPFSDRNNPKGAASREIRWAKKGGRYIITQKHTDNWMSDGRPVRCVKE